MLSIGCANKSTLTVVEKDEAFDAFIVENKLEQIDRIRSFRFDQWTALGRKHLILYSNFRTPYLVTLQRNCFDLDHTFQLAIEHSGSSLSAKHDYVMVPDLIPVRCYIKDIHKISKDQKKQLLAIGVPVEGGNSNEETKTLPDTKSAD